MATTRRKLSKLIDQAVMEQPLNSYLVYMHRCPNGKLYIGQTCRIAEERWGTGGANYSSQPLFWRAIKKYGWCNIEHIVLKEGLTHQQADELESKLIEVYSSCDSRFGYNCTSGGSYGRHSEETKSKLRKIALSRPSFTEEHRKHISEARHNLSMSEKQKQEYSERFSGSGNPMYGKHHSEESIMKMTEKRKNRPPMSLEERALRGEAQKERRRKYAESKQKKAECLD